VRQAGLAAALHMGEHVVVRVRTMEQRAMAGRIAFGEGLRHEIRICQQRSKPICDVRKLAFERIGGFQSGGARAAELSQRRCHGGLLDIAGRDSEIYAGFSQGYIRGHGKDSGMRRSILMAFALLLATVLPGAAQEFPSRVVKLVVPAASGSTTDTLA